MDVCFDIIINNTFHAYVKFLEKTSEYQVLVYTGLLNELHRILSSICERPGKSILRERMDRFRLRGRNRLFNLVYLYAVLWTCLHETAHVMAGHVDLWRELFPSVGAWSPGLSEVEAPCGVEDLCRFRELEADGYAVELLYDWRFAAAAMLVEEPTARAALDEGAIHPRYQRKIGRLLLFASLCCGLMLEKPPRQRVSIS